MKYKIAAFWLGVWGVLFAFLQISNSYHYYYIEQSQLFQSTWVFWVDRIGLPGGFALWLSEWIVQFFMLPYAGPAITGGLLVMGGWCTGRIVRRIAPQCDVFLLPLLPMLMLLLVHFDFNFLLCGVVAFDLMLLTLWLYVSIAAFPRRLIAGLLLTPVLYWLAGPVGALFAVSITLFELFSRTPKGYWIAFACVEVLLIGICCVYFSVTGEYRFAFLPNVYYQKSLEPKSVIYFSWVCLLFVLAVAFWLKRRPAQMTVKRKAGEAIIQLIVLGGLLYWGLPEYSDRKSARLKELDYYVRMEQWDRVINLCQGKLTNYLYLCYLNKALAEKGELADRIFAFDQRGPQGMLVAWNKAEQCSTILSEIYFTMGQIGLAQEMAFEGYVSAMGYGNPRLLKRLVQTNLIYGAYPIAEKYLNMLENTFYYKDWAKAQRTFLYKDAEVEADPVLGPRRKSLPSESTLSLMKGYDADLMRMAETNPSYKAPIEYLGAFYLLAKDLDGFKNLIEKYYGTEVLPVLPVSFQEALFILSEKEADYWKRFNLPDALQQRFYAYKQAVLAGQRNQSALPGLMYRSFGNTYWFYFMFK